MANYMQGRGYTWDSDKGNYIRTQCQAFQGAEEISEKDNLVPLRPQDTLPSDSGTETSEDLTRYIPLLNYLERNKESLHDLIASASDAGQIPRFVIPGIATTKSVHMMHSLDQLVKEFSNEKNISQRDLFEVALIEFLRRYGYAREVNALLNGDRGT